MKERHEKKERKERHVGYIVVRVDLLQITAQLTEKCGRLHRHRTKVRRRDVAYKH